MVSSLTLVIFYTILAVLLLFAIIFIYAQWSYTYWKRLNFPYITPTFPLGSFQLGSKTKHISTIMMEEYFKHKSKSKIIGVYTLIAPSLMIVNYELAKTIFGKDFHYFRDRGHYINVRDDPLSVHLFSANGDKWKVLREKLTPCFTSGKMKNMMPNIKKIGLELAKAIDDEIKIDKTIDIKEFCARYTTDVIGTYTFGIECNSFKDTDSEFRKMSRKVFTISPFKQLFTFNFHEISKILRLRFFDDDVTEFFVRIIKDTINHRENNNIQTTDFLNLLLEMRNKNKSDNPEDEDMDGLSLAEIISNSFMLFLGGFENTSTNMSYTLVELALNPEVQDKARNHVKEVLKRHNNEFTYEAMQEMYYLEACLHESLRRRSPAPFGFRRCSKDYKVPGTDFVIKKGMTIFIPFNAFHHDQELFEDPYKFMPERFLDKDTERIKIPYGYLAFADGPRICIGIRFAMMQLKIGIASVLTKFKFKMSEKTEMPLKFNHKTGFLQPMDLFLDVEKL